LVDEQADLNSKTLRVEFVQMESSSNQVMKKFHF